MIKRFRRVAGLIILGALGANFAAASADDASPAMPVVFDADVPMVTTPLPLFVLHDAADPSTAVAAVLKQQTVNSLALENGVLAARTGNMLRALVIPQSGEAIALPDLTILPSAPSGHAAISALDAARTALQTSGLIERDATQYRLTTPLTMMSATAGMREAPALTFFSAARFASGLPVYGSGSRLTIAVGDDGSVQGFLRRWRPATRSSRLIAPTATDAQIKVAITDQLTQYAGKTRIHVDRIDQAYYDTGHAYLQPVYRYSATVHTAIGTAGEEHVTGVVPVGKTVESLDDAAPAMSAATKTAALTIDDATPLGTTPVDLAPGHALLGYRTAPYLDTRRRSGFDRDLALGAHPAAAWLLQSAPDHAASDRRVTRDPAGKSAGFNRAAAFVERAAAAVPGTTLQSAAPDVSAYWLAD